jgi:hypothetical protein
MLDLTHRDAPEMAVPDLEGRPCRLADHRGRWLLLVFHRHLG